MNPEHFKIIKEINSLEEKLDKFQGLKNADKQRIQRLYNQKESKKEDLITFLANKDQLLKNTFNIDRRTMEIENELLGIETQLNSIFDIKIQNSLESRKNDLELELSTIQEDGIIELEKVEELEVSIFNAQNFLKGIDETIDEIIFEINQENQVQNIAESAVLERINSLEAELEDSFRNDYLKLKLQAPKNYPYSLLLNDMCQQCHFQLPKNLIAEIEDKYKLRTCIMCRRILIPTSSAY